MYKQRKEGVITGVDTTPMTTSQVYKVLKVPATTHFVIRMKEKLIAQKSSHRANRKLIRK